MPEKIVCNFFGSPNSGKTTKATGIFSLLKKFGHDVVLVPEFATEMVITGNHVALEVQEYIWSTQRYRIYAAQKHSKIVVTDSPILLGTLYNKPTLRQFIIDTHHEFDNINFFLRLDNTIPYSMAGRVHSLSESLVLEQQLLRLLESENIPYLLVDEYDDEEIVDLISNTLE